MQQEDSSAFSDLDIAHGYMLLFESQEENGNYLEALDCLQQAETIFRSAGDINYASCILNRANINTQLGHTEEAQKEYEAHVKILGKYVEDHPANTDIDKYTADMTESVERLGRLYFQQKQFDQSIRFLSAANKTYSQLHARNQQNLVYYRSYINSFEILGDVFLAIKQPEDAHTFYKNFHNLITAFIKPASPSSELDFDYSSALGKMGAIYMEKSQFNLSLMYYKQAIRHLRKHWETLGHLVEVRKEYAMLLVNTGNVYLALDKVKAAKKCSKAGSNMLAQLSADFPDNLWYKEIFSMALNKVGDLMSESGMYNDSLDYYLPCLRLKSELVKKKPAVVQFKTGVAVLHQNIGDIFRMQNQLDAALSNYKKFYKQTGKILKCRPAYPDQRRLQAIAMGRLAMVHNLRGSFTTALEYLKKSLQLSKQLFREYPLNAQYKDDLAVIFQDLGETYLQLGEIRKSLCCFLKYYRLAAALTIQFPENIAYRQGIAASSKKLAGIDMSVGKEKEALYFLEKFRLMQPDQTAATWELAILFEELGNVFSRVGLHKETLRAYLRFYSLMKTLVNQGENKLETRFNLAMAAWKLGLSYKVWNDNEQALPVFAEAKYIFSELISLYPDNEEYKNSLLLIEEHELLSINDARLHE